MHLGFIHALTDEIVAGRTGILEVRTEDSKTRLFITKGAVVYADQGTVGETLGRILLREKVIDEAAYERALEAMARARHSGSMARFGEIIVELGILTAEQVDAALAAQVQHKVLNCLKWEEVTFSFTPKESLGDIKTFPIELEPLLLRAMRLLDHAQKAALLGQHDHSRVTLKKDAGELATLLELKTPEARFLRSIDGERTTAEVLAAEVPDSVDPELLLCVLHLCGHIRFSAPTAEEREKKIASASAPAPVSLRRKREEGGRPGAAHSAKHGQRPSALRSHVRNLTKNERLRVKRAALRLRSRGEARSNTPLSMGRISVPSVDAAQLVAEQHYRRGRKLLRQNRLADAVSAFKRAVDLEPSAVEYRLYAAWASFKELPEKESERITAVRAIARRALKENGELGFAYYVLAHLAMRDGETTEAENLLRRARQLDPHIEEEKPLRIQKGKEPKPPPRIVSKPSTSAIVVPEAPPSVRSNTLPKPVLAETPPQQPPSPFAPAPSASKLVSATKPAALPPSVPTPPALPPRAQKPPPPKPAPPSIFTESAAKLKAAEPLMPGSTTTSSGTIRAASPPPPLAAPKSSATENAPDARDSHAPDLEPEWFSRPAPITQAQMVPNPPPSSGGPASRRDDATQRSAARGIVAPAIGVGLVVGAIAGIVAFASNGRTSQLPAPVNSVIAPSQVTTAPSNTPALTPTTGFAATSATVSGSTASAIPSAMATSLPSNIPSASPSPATSGVIAAPLADAGTVAQSTGILVLPSWSQGRRVFVDGKAIGEGPGELSAPCGTRQVQIGSAGKVHPADIPCGGKLTL